MHPGVSKQVDAIFLGFAPENKDSNRDRIRRGIFPKRRNSSHFLQRQKDNRLHRRQIVGRHLSSARLCDSMKMNPKQMEKMAKQLGMKMEEIDAEQVVIK